MKRFVSTCRGVATPTIIKTQQQKYKQNKNRNKTVKKTHFEKKKTFFGNLNFFNK